MYCRNSCVQIGLVCDEIEPKIRGRETWWDDDRFTAHQWREKASKKTMYMEKGHHKHCPLSAVN